MVNSLHVTKTKDTYQFMPQVRFVEWNCKENKRWVSKFERSKRKSRVSIKSSGGILQTIWKEWMVWIKILETKTYTSQTYLFFMISILPMKSIWNNNCLRIGLISI